MIRAAHDIRHDHATQYWQVTTAAGVTFCCRVRTSTLGVEVRLTTEGDELVRARVVPTLGAADDVARRWLQAVLAQSSVDEPNADTTLEAIH